ncbi:MAG: TerB family tellurite resistance protein [Xanthobacteraceae bacterium]
MLKEIKSFFADLTGGKQVAHFEDTDYRLAAAALMVHVATLEGDLSQASREKLHALLKACFELDDALTDELIDVAVAADHEAIDFYHFTSLLNRALNEEGRQRIVEMMWEMAYADGRVSEFEENVMWRVSDLLGVSARERIELRHQVADEQGGTSDKQ